MRNCWDIKRECPFRAEDPAIAACPAYAAQVPCWEFDWLGFHRAMPDGAGKTKWKSTMLEWCSNCEIRELHGEEVDSFLAKLRRT